jgi:opacity protein-like surface antigen
MPNMKKLIVALIAGAAAMSAAQAQNFTDTQPHAYVGVGASTAKNIQSDDYKLGGKIYGGYQVNQTWAAEAGYTDFGDHDAANGTTKGNGYYVAAKATMPINEQFSAYGKVGVQRSERKFNSAALSLKDTDTGAYGALGVQYKLNQQVALTAEYERYGKEKDLGAKANAWTVGAHYNF